MYDLHPHVSVFTRAPIRPYIISDKAHSAGILPPGSSIGKGTIIEYAVIVTLGDCVKEYFNCSYDIASSSLGLINVKSSAKHGNGRGGWQWTFKKSPRSKIPDVYICVGLDPEFKSILHVWEIPGGCELVGKYGISVSDSERGLNRLKTYEVDPYKFNWAYMHMDITSIPEFCNIETKNFRIYQSIAKDVNKNIPLEKIKQEYGEDCYEEYVKWINDACVRKCFNVTDGSIGTMRDLLGTGNPNLLEFTETVYPVFSCIGEYKGYNYNGRFRYPGLPKKSPNSSYSTIKGTLIIHLSESGDIISKEEIIKESGVEDVDGIIHRLCMVGKLFKISNGLYQILK